MVTLLVDDTHMSFDRRSWDLDFTAGYSPTWLCPACGGRSLNLDRETLKIIETKSSKSAHGHDAWEPEWVEKRFVCLLRCAGKACREVVAVTGRTEQRLEHDYDNQLQYEEYLLPLYVVPALPFFKVPEGCPEPLHDEIQKAFALFWCDPGAAANRVRSSVELLMDHIGVKRQQRMNNGKFVRLSLHRRVEIFQKQDEALGSSLLALKWIGNTGSHTGDLTREDLFDAFEILNHVLDEVITKRTKRIADLTKKINKTKGPLSAATRRRHSFPF